MTTPAFRSLIAVNTASLDERTTPMTATSLGISYRINELAQVANDLRNERALGAPRTPRANRFRLAVGTALVSLGTAVAPTARPRIQAR